MTDRHAGYIVTLENDTRDDDSEATITALTQIKGVIAVEPVIATPELHFAEARVRRDMERRIYSALHDN